MPQCPDGRGGRSVGVTPWCQLGHTQGLFALQGAVETRGDNPRFSPWVCGTAAVPGAGERRVNGPAPCATGSSGCASVSRANARSSQAELSISPAPQCPSQFPRLLLIGATLSPPGAVAQPALPAAG